MKILQKSNCSIWWRKSWSGWSLVPSVFLLLLLLYPDPRNVIARPLQKNEEDSKLCITWDLPCQRHLVAWSKKEDQLKSLVNELEKFKIRTLSNLTLDSFFRHYPFFQKFALYNTQRQSLLHQTEVLHACQVQYSLSTCEMKEWRYQIPKYRYVYYVLQMWTAFRPQVCMQSFMVAHTQTLQVLHQYFARVVPFDTLPVNRGFLKPAQYAFLDEQDAMWLVSCYAALSLNRLDAISTSASVEVDSRQCSGASRGTVEDVLDLIRDMVVFIERKWYRLYVRAPPVLEQGAENDTHGMLLGCAAGWELVAAHLSKSARLKLQVYARLQNQAGPCGQQMQQPHKAHPISATPQKEDLCPNF